MSDEIMELPPPLPDSRLSYGSESLQFGELRLPVGPGPHPLAIVLHGGFWRARYGLAYIGHLCQSLRVAGVGAWNLEYRRLDLGGGWPNTMLDVGAGIDHVRVLANTYPIDLGRVVAIGHSAGGHLALWSAARGRIPTGDPLYHPDPLAIRGAVSLAGVADLTRGWEMGLGDGVVETFMGGSPASVPARYRVASPAALLPLGVPQVLVHGTEDDVVPFTVSERYAEQARAFGDDARLVTLDGDDHWAPVDPRTSAWPLVLDAVRALIA